MKIGIKTIASFLSPPASPTIQAQTDLVSERKARSPSMIVSLSRILLPLLSVGHIQVSSPAWEPLLLAKGIWVQGSMCSQGPLAP